MLQNIVNDNPNHVDEKFKIFLDEIEHLEMHWRRLGLRHEAPISWVPTHLDWVEVLSDMSGIDLSTGYRRRQMVSRFLAWADHQLEALSPVDDDPPEPVDGYEEYLKDRPTPYEVRESIRGCFQGLIDQHGFTIDDLVTMMSEMLHFDLSNPQRDFNAIREELWKIEDDIRLAFAPVVDKVEV